MRIRMQDGEDFEQTPELSTKDIRQRLKAKLPFDTPVIETFCPTADGLPRGVFDEWGGASLGTVKKSKAHAPKRP